MIVFYLALSTLLYPCYLSNVKQGQMILKWNAVWMNSFMQSGWIHLCSHCCRGCHFIFVYVQWTM